MMATTSSGAPGPVMATTSFGARVMATTSSGARQRRGASNMALTTLETMTPAATAVSTPSTRTTDWRDGLPVLTGSMISLRELRASDAADLLASLGTAEV